MTTTAPQMDVAAILARPVHDLRPGEPLRYLVGKRILVTGAAGSIGSSLVPLLSEHGCEVWATDIDAPPGFRLDVTSSRQVRDAIGELNPHVVFHLAGAKHAPQGESDPWGAMQVNTVGTRNILIEAPLFTRVVMASTCKACNPETAYGASKLIAERMTLNANHSVARFYNVIESHGNVFEIWGDLHRDDPVPWTDCRRFFITMSEAVGLTLWAAILPPARYVVHPGASRSMRDIAATMYPQRNLIRMERRRGDRRIEPLRGTHETVVGIAGMPALAEVISPHDQAIRGTQ